VRPVFSALGGLALACTPIPIEPAPQTGLAPTVPEPLLVSEIELALPTHAASDLCTGVASMDKDVGTTTFSFPPLTVPATTWGPRFSDSPGEDLARSETDVSRWLQARVPALQRCYTNALVAQPELEGELPLALLLSPNGSISKLGPEPAGRFAEWSLCATKELSSAANFAATGRELAIDVGLQFERGPKPAPPSNPPRTKLERRQVTHVECLRAPRPVPRDTFRLAEPLRIVAPQVPEPTVEPPCKAPCRKTSRPAMRVARAVVRPMIESSLVNRVLRYNLGAYSRCFWDAGPQAVGLELDFAIELPAHGRPSSVVLTRSSAPAPELAACLQTALSELRFPAIPASASRIELPLVGGPREPALPALPPKDTATNIRASAEAALRALDGETAARRFNALEQQAPSCESALGLLRALMIARPWFDEPVDAAARTVIARAHGYCLEQAVPFLSDLAHTPRPEGRALHSVERLELAAKRYRALLQVDDAKLREQAAKELAELEMSLKYPD
jgi:hypothetical protein